MRTSQKCPCHPWNKEEPTAGGTRKKQLCYCVAEKNIFSRKVTFTSNKTLPLKRSSEGRDKKLHICAGSEVHFLRSGAGCCYAFHRQELHELDLSRKQEEKVFGKKNEDSGSNDDVVECPLCSRRFSAAEIARHCDGCGGGDQDDIGSQAGPSSSSTSSCPVCGEAIRAEDLPSHAPACAERLFG